MASTVESIKRIEVPFVVVVGEHKTNVSAVRNWIPGSIIELAIPAEEDLEIRINNRAVGKGNAVKIGENFGIRISEIIGKTDRIMAMGEDEGGDDEMSPDEIAEALLAGQL